MSLKDLFNEREDNYADYTQKILLHMKKAVAGIHNVLGNTADHITWKLVELVDDEYIALAGVVVWPLGHAITAPSGRQIFITEENQERFSRFVRVGLPLDLVENGSTDDVIEFLKDKLDIEEDSEGLPDEEAFSAEDLTEDQKQQLRMFSSQAKGRIN